MVNEKTAAQSSRPQSALATLSPYLRIARFDHWFKNIFMLPGVVVALFARPEPFSIAIVGQLVLALVATGMIASSNYVLNELLDAKYDALHPIKKSRPVPSGLVHKPLAVLEWLLFATAGILFAQPLGHQFLYVLCSLWVMGCIYNIPPVRSKDKPFVDVLSESVNNPIRLALGWYATGVTVLPPLSLLLAYWMVGAFFMAIKRLAEFRMIGSPKISADYRRSFAYYNEERLIKSIVYYATAFGLFFGIFLIRYRMELILSIPLIAGFMTWYIHLGFIENSPAQYPEHLYRQRGFVIYCLLCSAVLMLLLFVPIPQLYEMFRVSFTP